jgi:Tfp pilus assembly protein PilO
MKNIKESFNYNKNIILNFIIIIIALSFAYNLYKNEQKNLALLKEKKETETKKNAVLEEIKQSEKVIFAYKDFINGKDITAVINTLNKTAKEFSINILSMRPLPEESFPLYTKFPFNLRIEVNDYHTIGKFISRLESHPDIYEVETVTIAPDSNAPGAEVNKLIIDLKISTFLIKDQG